jgi:hypothetical protein
MERQMPGAVAQMEKTSPVSPVRLSNKQEPAGAQAAGREADKKAHGAILMRSTGLGKAELVGEVISLRRQGDYLIMEVHTTQPVRWKVRVGLSHKDLRTLLKAMLKRSVLSFLLNLRGWSKDPTHPGDF